MYGDIVISHKSLGRNLHGSSPHVDFADFDEDRKAPSMSWILLSRRVSRTEDHPSLVVFDYRGEGSP